MARFAGFSSKRSVKALLQAQLYWNRKRSREKSSEPPPPGGEGNSYAEDYFAEIYTE
ncbi:hypothetical protein Knedl_CDS0083 [Pseudomonas phage Knedl]|uniref:Uncharacterized protein n=1 Tax=Pseudomonas phage vB_PaeS_HTN2 TaxID=3236647 RepID=A0AB39AI92_9VIRU|nr:hypothetical protein Knedl_CDS0083 [Pseudomonas phage Knedl]